MMDDIDAYTPRNYYGAMNDASGFKYRVDGKDVVSEVLDALRGGTRKNKYGKTEYNEAHRMMNDLGMSRAKVFLQGVVNKNTHLSKYSDKEMIMKQVQALSKEWCVTIATNRKAWEVKDPDLVQHVVETGILSALLRADEGFEAELSGKSHHVNETYQSGMPQQGGVGFGRFAPWNWGRGGGVQ